MVFVSSHLFQDDVSLILPTWFAFIRGRHCDLTYIKYSKILFDIGLNVATACLSILSPFISPLGSLDQIRDRDVPP